MTSAVSDVLLFTVHATDGAARTGVIATARGEIRTPAFMPIGTAGTVKAMLPESVRETGADIILGNTYHLMLRPGAERVAKLGGLHKMMNWPRPILTDSGGFQVMSLAQLRKLDEQGVSFQSHLDGDDVRADAGTLDGDSGAARLGHPHGARRMHAVSRRAKRRPKARWNCRCAGRSGRRRRFARRRGARCSASCRAACIRDLRERSAAALKEIGFPGYAVGGLAVGEGQARMFEVLDFTVPHLPAIGRAI